MNKKLYRIEDTKKIAGVCGGIAEYLKIDPTIIRLGWALAGLCGGTGIVAYVVAALIIPTKSEVM